MIGKSKESQKAYEKSIKLQPSHKVALVNLGRQLKAMGQSEGAEAAYRRYSVVKIILEKHSQRIIVR